MSKYLCSSKKYTVNGELLMLIQSLIDMYEAPFCQYDGEKYEIKQIPLSQEKRDYLIGRLAQEFERMEWEEL